MAARPRGYLARTLYDKYNNDQYIENYDFTNWYKLPNDGKEILEKWVSGWMREFLGRLTSEKIDFIINSTWKMVDGLKGVRKLLESLKGIMKNVLCLSKTVGVVCWSLLLLRYLRSSINHANDVHIFRYRVKFFDLQEPDPITLSWIEESKAKSSQLWLQIWHIIAKLFLKIFLTQTCCNGLLRRGSMYILSENVSPFEFLMSLPSILIDIFLRL